MQITQTEHTCAKCATLFVTSSLGDFSYGEFLLWSAPRECAYLNALDDTTYEEVFEIIKNYCHAEFSKTTDVSELLQKIYGEVACDFDRLGRSYKISSPPCPNCGSTLIATVGEEKISIASIDAVTHQRWESLTSQQKIQSVIAAVARVCPVRPEECP